MRYQVTIPKFTPNWRLPLGVSLITLFPLLCGCLPTTTLDTQRAADGGTSDSLGIGSKNGTGGFRGSDGTKEPSDSGSSAAGRPPSGGSTSTGVAAGVPAAGHHSGGDASNTINGGLFNSAGVASTSVTNATGGNLGTGHSGGDASNTISGGQFNSAGVTSTSLTNATGGNHGIAGSAYSLEGGSTSSDGSGGMFVTGGNATVTAMGGTSSGGTVGIGGTTTSSPNNGGKSTGGFSGNIGGSSGAAGLVGVAIGGSIGTDGPPAGAAGVANSSKYCAAAPCQNGGSCVSGASRFVCCCQPGFVGEHCESEETWTAFALGTTTWGENTVGKIVVDTIDPKVIYASDDNGSTGDSVWLSVDSGANWTVYCDKIWGADAIALAPTTAQTVYLAPGAGYGIYKVPGAGVPCREISLGGYGYYTSVAVDPRNASRVYAGSSRLSTNTPGIFRSLDAGAGWTMVNSDLCVSSLMLDPLNGSVYVVGIPDWDVFGTPNTLLAGVWKSDDDGKNWTQVVSGRGIVFAFDLNSANTSHLVAATELSGVVYSDDRGMSWHPSTGATGLRINTVASDHDNASFAYIGTTDNGVLRSTDGGATWTQFSEGMVYSTVLELVVNPNDSRTIYAGLEGKGIYRRRLPGASGACTLQLPPDSDPFCENTCKTSKDGWCDDGGPLSNFSTCDMGTDCQDCGTRSP